MLSMPERRRSAQSGFGPASRVTIPRITPQHPLQLLGRYRPAGPFAPLGLGAGRPAALAPVTEERRVAGGEGAVNAVNP